MTRCWFDDGETLKIFTSGRKIGRLNTPAADKILGEEVPPDHTQSSLRKIPLSVCAPNLIALKSISALKGGGIMFMLSSSHFIFVVHFRSPPP